MEFAGCFASRQRRLTPQSSHPLARKTSRSTRASLQFSHPSMKPLDGHRCGLIVLFIALVAPMPAADRLPNIILFLCDNLGYGDIGPFGSTLHRTPNLDRMANE